MLQWFLVPFAYLLGSLSSAVIVSRLLQLPDPREEGSKNPGATNVLRLGGKKAAVITLLGDMFKGLIPLLVAKGLDAPVEILAAAGVAAFLGHLYPVFFGFRGGKGVATALGVLLGYSWVTGTAVLVTWLVVAYFSRMSSLSALIAAALAPVYVGWWLGGLPLVSATVLMSALLIWRHRENIARIRRGEESRIGR
ncbi:glycerol-3-phosphate 1-O-acyltransferase PlsY [Methyloterricola oryzae]|uniref:glycerol-3-phosphate 1-O-acyltransferase PlsY n=1 Tax=Methyloterricola oryzae TaxID=1495050 RepID=UPI0005EB1FCB|nr:glycerol-3-phosphate 1-O-acyltransferase PlsY [Methyloterricola oryzae]